MQETLHDSNTTKTLLEVRSSAQKKEEDPLRAQEQDPASCPGRWNDSYTRDMRRICLLCKLAPLWGELFFLHRRNFNLLKEKLMKMNFNAKVIRRPR